MLRSLVGSEMCIRDSIVTESKGSPQGAPNLTARAFRQIAGRRSGYRQKRSPAHRIRREICDRHRNYSIKQVLQHRVQQASWH